MQSLSLREPPNFILLVTAELIPRLRREGKAAELGIFHLPTGISQSFPASQSVLPGSSPSARTWPSLRCMAPSKPGLLCLPHSRGCWHSCPPHIHCVMTATIFLGRVSFSKDLLGVIPLGFKQHISKKNVASCGSHVLTWEYGLYFDYTMPWCVHPHALLPYRASQTTSITVCDGCILERVALPQPEALVSRLPNSSSVFPVLSQMPHVQRWGRKRMV